MSLLCFSATVSAASTVQNSVSVSPAIEQLQLSSGQDSADFPVSIRNGTDVAVQATVGFTDFKALNDSGGVAFLGQHSNSLQTNKHGLVSWVQLGSQQVGLAPGQQVTINVHLEKLRSLPPGGHYGAITYTVVPTTLEAIGNHVSFNQVLTTLLFLTTADGGTEHVTMLPPTGIGWLRTSLPTRVNLFFKNDGNTQTAPRGSVNVYGSNPAKPAATAVINHGSALVLPDSVRQLPTDLTLTQRSWWPHHYHVQIRYRPDAAQSFTTYPTGFWYVPPIWFPVTAVLIWFLVQLFRRKRMAKPSTDARATNQSRLRRIAHTLKIETRLVWRDTKLLLRWLYRKVASKPRKQVTKSKKPRPKT